MFVADVPWAIPAVVYRGALALHRLGFTGIKKAVVGAALQGVKCVPALAKKVKEEEDVRVASCILLVVLCALCFVPSSSFPVSMCFYSQWHPPRV